MTNDDRRSKDERGSMIERDHPQTRRGEPDARGSAIWRDDVDRPDDERDREEGSRKEGCPEGAETATVAELAKEAEAVRKQAVGAETAGGALGSGAGRDAGSGTNPDRGELGGGEPSAEEGTSTPPARESRAAKAGNRLRRSKEAAR